MILFSTIAILFQIYSFMLLARILSSWFPEYREHKIVQFISFYTDPYLNLFRNIIPPLGMIDISPIFAFLSLGVIEYAIKYLLLLIIR